MNIYSLDSIPGRTTFYEGKEFLFFSGYAYLGMQYVPEFTQLVKEGIDKYGWLYPSSRISNTRLQLFETCETMLSSLTSSEDTVLISSGFLAGNIATHVFQDKIINLSPFHPAIKINNNAPENEATIIAIDSVDILSSSITDVSFNGRETISTIIIDDSHGIGLLGAKGEGISSMVNKHPGRNYVFTYSLSKAFNITAGAVSCTKTIAEQLRKLPGYAAATGPSPALLHAFIKGRHLYDVQREKLNKNIHYFQSLIKELPHIKNNPRLPIFILPEETNEQALFEAGIIISSFAYPDSDGRKYKRIVLNALHTKNDLEILARCLRQLLA